MRHLLSLLLLLLIACCWQACTPSTSEPEDSPLQMSLTSPLSRELKNHELIAVTGDGGTLTLSCHTPGLLQVVGIELQGGGTAPPEACSYRLEQNKLTLTFGPNESDRTRRFDCTLRVGKQHFFLHFRQETAEGCDCM